MDLISIIIPVYNVEKYVAECLDSVLSQDYSNIEVIVVDDGSTDQSGVICDQFAEKDSRIRVIHKKNEGVAATRNVGLKNVSPEAKYIGFVDSDDIVSKNLYTNLVEAITENHADMAITGFARINDDHKFLEKPSEGIIREGTFSKEEIINQSVEAGGWCFRILWNKLYKKELFKGLSFVEKKIHEDEAISYSLIMRCRKVSCIESSDYYYRVSNSQSIMQNRTKKRNADLLDAFLFNTKLLAKHRYNYAAGKMMLRAAMEYGSLCRDKFEQRKECQSEYRKVLKYLKYRKVLNFKTAAVCSFIKICPILGYNLITVAKHVLI